MSAPKKPLAASSNARASTPSTPSTNATNRSPSRTSNQSTTNTRGPSTASTAGSTTTNASPAALNRARSVRNGAPPSARAAVTRKPAEQDNALEDLRAEMQAKLDELQSQVAQSEQALAISQKNASLLQAKLDEALKEQSILEENVHEQTERVEELENARKDVERAKRELEQIYETERAAAIREREETQTKHDDMETAMLRMKESLSQREMRTSLSPDDRPSPSRGSSFRTNGSPGPDGGGQFAPPSSLQRSDSRSSSKLVMQKDKIIEGLRMEIAEAQLRIVELENMGGGQLQETQRQLYEAKVQNARLMEENESFQLLLSEKTLNGDFAQSDLLNPPSSAGSRPPSRQPDGRGASLADELASTEDGEENDVSRRHAAEINGLKDQNKALTLYINNIISRLLQHEQFAEQILDKSSDLLPGASLTGKRFTDANKALPPPPPPKDGEPSGFLQRAKSVMGAAARPKRPLSLAQPTADVSEPRLTENPDTAPSIPLGRSSSVRASQPHRRTNSDWNAASVVTSMYRGPSPGLQGPMSPGLASPTARGPFFTRTASGQRVTSGTGLPPTSDPDLTGKENAQRDSKVSERNSAISPRHSMTSNPGFVAPAESTDGSEPAVVERSNPSSPPRSVASSGDKDSRGGTGAVMMGSKMRPLRLVQEASKEDEAAKKMANRGSWFGWMNTGKAGPPTGSGV